MAPEIRQGHNYDGRKVDVFSMGVVFFTLLVGYFPFSKAEIGDPFYDLLNYGPLDYQGINNQYWNSFGASDLSVAVKDLLQRILCPDPNYRLSVEQIK